VWPCVCRQCSDCVKLADASDNDVFWSAVCGCVCAGSAPTVSNWLMPVTMMCSGVPCVAVCVQAVCSDCVKLADASDNDVFWSAVCGCLCAGSAPTVSN